MYRWWRAELSEMDKIFFFSNKRNFQLAWLEKSFRETSFRMYLTRLMVLLCSCLPPPRYVQEHFPHTFLYHTSAAFIRYCAFKTFSYICIEQSRLLNVLRIWNKYLKKIFLNKSETKNFFKMKILLLLFLSLVMRSTAISLTGKLFLKLKFNNRNISFKIFNIFFYYIQLNPNRYFYVIFFY